jgi:beta-glucosidase
LDAITNYSSIDGTTVSSSLSDTDTDAAASTARGKDVALVFITADSGEDGYIVEGNTGDRNNLQAWHDGVSNLFPFCCSKCTSEIVAG